MEQKDREKKDVFDRLFALPFFRIFAPLYYRYREVWLYLFFGVLTTAVSWGTFYLFCYPLAWSELTANLLSWVAAVLFAYLTNRTWVFSAERTPAAFVRQLLLFFGARLSSLVMEEIILFVFVTQLAYDAMLIKMIANVLVLIANYFLSKFLVFRKRNK